MVVYNDAISSEHPWKSFDGFTGRFSSEMTLKELQKLVKGSDMVIAGGWVRRYSFMAMIYGFLYGKKTIMTTDYPFHPRRLPDLFKKVFLYRNIDYIFCATQSTISLLSQKFGNTVKGKLRLFPYGIDTTAEKIEIVNSGSKDINILTATNFLPRKGHAVLFKALQLLDQQDMEIKKKFHFTFVGAGAELEKCKRMATQMSLDISFLGWVENEEYRKLMRETDVYIHPSIEEPFGIPPVDAMCMGKVVIACDGVMSVNGLLRQGENGYHYVSPIVDDEAHKQLAKILISLDKCKFEAIGFEAHNDAVRLFSFDQYVDMLATL